MIFSFFHTHCVQDKIGLEQIVNEARRNRLGWFGERNDDDDWVKGCTLFDWSFRMTNDDNVRLGIGCWDSLDRWRAGLNGSNSSSNSSGKCHRINCV